MWYVTDFLSSIFINKLYFILRNCFYIVLILIKLKGYTDIHINTSRLTQASYLSYMHKNNL